jgi:plasmid stability protein
MASLTIRNLDEVVKRALRRRAAERGISMEQEVRDVLTASVRKQRGRSILRDLEALSIKPKQPFDQKAVSDEMWDESL